MKLLKFNEYFLSIKKNLQRKILKSLSSSIFVNCLQIEPKNTYLPGCLIQSSCGKITDQGLSNLSECFKGLTFLKSLSLSLNQNPPKFIVLVDDTGRKVADHRHK